MIDTAVTATGANYAMMTATGGSIIEQRQGLAKAVRAGMRAEAGEVQP